MEKHRFHLILPGELWQRIKALALRNRRSATQEILLAIEDHVDKAGTQARSQRKEGASEGEGTQ